MNEPRRTIPRRTLIILGILLALACVGIAVIDVKSFLQVMLLALITWGVWLIRIFVKEKRDKKDTGEHYWHPYGE